MLTYLTKYSTRLTTLELLKINSYNVKHGQTIDNDNFNGTHLIAMYYSEF